MRYRVNSEPETLYACHSAQPWFELPPGVPKYDTQPPEAWKVLFQLWRER